MQNVALIRDKHGQKRGKTDNFETNKKTETKQRWKKTPKKRTKNTILRGKWDKQGTKKGWFWDKKDFK